MAAVNEGLKTCGKPSRGRYVQGCRCYMCRVANAEYALAQSHGENEKAMVGRGCCDRARARIGELLESGWSLNQVCRCSGVPESSIHALLYGHGNTPTFKGGGKRRTSKMRRENYVAIMALPDRPTVADAALVDGMALARGVRWAAAHGHSCAAMARDAGIGAQIVYRLRDAENGATVRHSTMRRLAPVLLRYATEARDS